MALRKVDMVEVIVVVAVMAEATLDVMLWAKWR